MLEGNPSCIFIVKLLLKASTITLVVVAKQPYLRLKITIGIKIHNEENLRKTNQKREKKKRERKEGEGAKRKRNYYSTN